MSEQTPVIEHKDHFHGSDLEKIEEIYVKVLRSLRKRWQSTSM